MIIRINNIDFQCYFEDNLLKENSKVFWKKEEFPNIKEISGLSFAFEKTFIDDDSSVYEKLNNLLYYLMNCKYIKDNYSAYVYTEFVGKYNKLQKYSIMKNDFISDVPVWCIHLKDLFVLRRLIETENLIDFRGIYKIDDLKNFGYISSLFLLKNNTFKSKNDELQFFNNIIEIKEKNKIIYPQRIEPIINSNGIFIYPIDINIYRGYHIYAKNLTLLYEEIMSKVEWATCYPRV